MALPTLREEKKAHARQTAGVKWTRRHHRLVCEKLLLRRRSMTITFPCRRQTGRPSFTHRGRYRRGTAAHGTITGTALPPKRRSRRSVGGGEQEIGKIPRMRAASSHDHIDRGYVYSTWRAHDLPSAAFSVNPPAKLLEQFRSMWSPHRTRVHRRRDQQMRPRPLLRWP